MAETHHQVSPEAPWSGFTAPAALAVAARRVDQTRVLARSGRRRPYTRDMLVSLMREAIEQGIIRTVEVSFPARGVLPVVDEDGLQECFDQFVLRMSARELRSFGGLRWMLRGVRRGSLVRRHAKAALAHPWWERASWVATPVFLRAGERVSSSPEWQFRLVSMTPLRPGQHKGEICELLRLIRDQNPDTLLEIGTSRGGTSYLLLRQAADGATFATVDLSHGSRRVVRSFARGRQRVELVTSSSQDAATAELLRTVFPTGLDVLMIDGDHSYEGARKDFELYSPRVRHNGMVIFHDIMPDNRARLGVDTGGWSGGVPALWQELKLGARHREFFVDPGQDGLGIGVLWGDGKGGVVAETDSK